MYGWTCAVLVGLPIRRVAADTIEFSGRESFFAAVCVSRKCISRTARVFARFYGPILFVFVLFVVSLNAMQVGAGYADLCSYHYVISCIGATHTFPGGGEIV